MSNSNCLFDPTVRKQRRSRALRMNNPGASTDFLLMEAADCLLDRFLDIRRTFPIALDIGAHTGQLANLLRDGKHVGTVISAETHCDLVQLCPLPAIAIPENVLPFADNSLDLVIGCMSMHWVNDLPSLLSEAHRILKPDGLLLVTLAGEETLHELRESFARAELDIEGGISPRIAPMITIKDAGALLQAAGFENPIADRDRVTVDYPNPLKLMHDLREMGETNSMFLRKKTPLRRSTLFKMMQYYQELFTNAEGRYLATFDLVTLTGWKQGEALT